VTDQLLVLDRETDHLIHHRVHEEDLLPGVLGVGLLISAYSIDELKELALDVLLEDGTVKDSVVLYIISVH